MHSSTHPHRRGTTRRRTIALGGASAMVLAALPALAGAAPSAVAAAAATPAAPIPVVAPIPAITGHIMARTGNAAPVSTTQCETTYAIACYSPLQYRIAYDLNPLYKKGITGAGETIVIVDSYGSLASSVRWQVGV